MTSTDVNVGFAQNRSSSRVLKPPGGGHSNIFGDVPAVIPQQRPASNQQNSAGVSAAMGTPDANKKIEEISHSEKPVTTPTGGQKTPTTTPTGPAPLNDMNAQKQRVPPGGFSSGFW